jgi:small subunit ribosomal protein S15
LPQKGKSRSRRPVSKRAPSWCRYSPEEVEAFVTKLAKDEVPSSRIGLFLRDQYGIPLVKPVVGKSINEILKERNLKPAIPEDLTNLINKVNRLTRHLSKNKSDSVNKHSLELIVSKVRRLAKYYMNRHSLPENWEYKPEVTLA